MGQSSSRDVFSLSVVNAIHLGVSNSDEEEEDESPPLQTGDALSDLSHSGKGEVIICKFFDKDINII